MSLFLTIQGEPVAKGRPRMTKTGHCYTPAKTRSYEAAVAMQAKAQLKGQKPLEGPLAVTVSFFMGRPKSVKREYPAIKPDVDNLIKSLDALNGIVWVDDSQICSINAEKFYSGEPRTVIVVSRLGVSD